MRRNRLARLLPDPHRVRNHRLLRWLGPKLHHPRLWHVSRRGVAMGVSIGVFFGLLIPIAQIPTSAVAAVILRANLPTAMVSTLVTNPFTFAPIYYLAYRIGMLLMGDTDPTVTEASVAAGMQEAAGWLDIWSDRLLSLGKPLLLGLVIMAITLSVASYFLVDWLWRARTVWAWRRRKLRRARRL